MPNRVKSPSVPSSPWPPEVTWDSDRVRRKGYPESVYGAGKSWAQLLEVAHNLQGTEPVLFTRLDPKHATALQRQFPAQPMTYYNRSRVLVWGQLPEPDPHRLVAVISAGTADLPVAEEAVIALKAAGVTVLERYDVGVAGIHRLFRVWPEIQHADVFIVVAGMDGALPSVVGGLAPRPVIAVPTSVGYGAHFQGLAPLLTMLTSCAEGVAVVNIDNGFGAGRLAVQILSLKTVSAPERDD
jgi:NCAIR mutase (PurE)-related protein